MLSACPSPPAPLSYIQPLVKFYRTAELPAGLLKGPRFHPQPLEGRDLMSRPTLRDESTLFTSGP